MGDGVYWHPLASQRRRKEERSDLTSELLAGEVVEKSLALHGPRLPNPPLFRGHERHAYAAALVPVRALVGQHPLSDVEQGQVCRCSQLPFSPFAMCG